VAPTTSVPASRNFGAILDNGNLRPLLLDAEGYAAIFKPIDAIIPLARRHQRIDHL